MFFEIPQQQILIIAGAFLFGWLLSSISASLSSNGRSKKLDPKDDRIRNLEAELRISRTDAESAKEKATTLEEELEEASTGNEKRDGHLLSADFFEADKHPYITFKSTSIQSNGNGQLVARGLLTIKGESSEIDLPITMLGKQDIPEEMQQMLGGTTQVASFKASTAVDRNVYGVGVGNWAATLVVGGEVKIEILLEAHRR